MMRRYRKLGSPRSKRVFALFSLFLIAFNFLCLNLPRTSLAASLPAFPGAEGFGAYTPGGRGGRVIKVTNLNDSGSGSLREALEAKDKRIVIFEVSGTIVLKDKIEINDPYITVAGQTAPGAGITLRNYPITVNTHDVILRYLRLRTGDSPPGGCRENDSLSVRDSQNVIVDHVSASWGIDENLSVTHGGSDKITVQWSIISEALNNSCHSKGLHGYGGILGGHITEGQSRISFHHNLYAHNYSRNPKFAAEQKDDIVVCNQADFRNNVIYDWGSKAGYTSNGECTRVNYVANYLKPGLSTAANIKTTAVAIAKYSEAIFYAKDNMIEGFPEADNNNWLMINLTEKRRRDSPFNYEPVVTTGAKEAYNEVLAKVGAILPKRDQVDQRLITEVKNGTGRIINSQNDVGGWPQMQSVTPPKDSDSDGMPDTWETNYGLNPNDGSDGAKDADNDGYTNVEEYLNDTIAAVLPTKVPTQTPTLVPTSTPAPARSPTSTKAPTRVPTVTMCRTTSKGDADCNSITDLHDFALWLAVYRKTAQGKKITVEEKGRMDFNMDGSVSLVDFAVWKQNYLPLVK